MRCYANQPASKRRLPEKESSAVQRTPGLQQQQVPPAVPSRKTDGEDYIPPALDRPIGVATPPREDQNTGIDSRSLRQRRDDFVDYDKHLERRKELYVRIYASCPFFLISTADASCFCLVRELTLSTVSSRIFRTRQVAKPYFRDWSNMRYHQGKTFMSNLRLFKHDKALYMPNLCGVTLASPKQPRSTTAVLRGKVSVVSIFSSVWAESQAATFTGQTQNPGLHEVLQTCAPFAQRVEVNLEENALKAALVRMFMWRMRASLPKEQHERYFLVRKGFSDSLKQAIWMMNSKVGYVYLVDQDCRIRWAGSGPADPAELEALNNGVRKLAEDDSVRSKPRVVMMP